MNYVLHRKIPYDICTSLGVLAMYCTLYKHRSSTVVKVLRYISEGRWFDPINSFRSHYGPGVDSANGNEYQDYFLGVKAAGA